MPDVISLLGAPEKLISFPQIGYFDIKGPAGNIKTIVTPLKSEADYFGDVKKPRLTVINEKVKEIGGVPRHGSLFLVEENDGSVFVVEIDGDSGVGKSEMIAAFVLKWLRNNLEGIRSVKMIAGICSTSSGCRRQSVRDRNRSGRFLADDRLRPRLYQVLQVPVRKQRRQQCGRPQRPQHGGRHVRHHDAVQDRHHAQCEQLFERRGRYYAPDNPETFLLYTDAHGERKEKATSGDGPNFQRTLKRYTADKGIVEVISRHGNYLDDILDWDYNPSDKQYYLASSFKLLDKIDVTEVVKMIFVNRRFVRDGISYLIEDVSFDMIQNRFIATAVYESDNERSIPTS